MKRKTNVATPIAHLVGPGQIKVINGHIAFKRHGEDSVRLEPTALTDVYCYGEVSITGSALDLLFRHSVNTAWFTPAGARCRGRLTRTDASTTATRLRQHQVLASVTNRTDWARFIVNAKIQSALETIRRYQRNGVPTESLLNDLAGYQDRVKAAASIDEIRGLEGVTSAIWFRFFGTLLEAPWYFTTRSRRPPKDPVNALLSLAYTWLLNKTTAALEARGYEIYLGGLHEYRPGRPSLSCDIMEPLRVPAVDRWVVAVCNTRDISPNSFVMDEQGGYRLKPGSFGSTLFLWEKFWCEGRFGDRIQLHIHALDTFIRERVSQDLLTEELPEQDL